MNKEDVIYIYIYICIHTHIHKILLSHKKEWNNAICSNMDEPRDYHTMWSKPKTSIMWYCLYMEFEKKDTDELIYKTETDSQTQKTSLWLPKGKVG